MSEVRYVQRDPNTHEITGHFSHPHSYAREELPEDHPDLQSYRAKREAQRRQVSPLKEIMERLAVLEAKNKGA